MDSIPRFSSSPKRSRDEEEERPSRKDMLMVEALERCFKRFGDQLVERLDRHLAPMGKGKTSVRQPFPKGASKMSRTVDEDEEVAGEAPEGEDPPATPDESEAATGKGHEGADAATRDKKEQDKRKKEERKDKRKATGRSECKPKKRKGDDGDDDHDGDQSGPAGSRTRDHSRTRSGSSRQADMTNSTDEGGKQESSKGSPTRHKALAGTAALDPIDEQDSTEELLEELVSFFSQTSR